MLKQDHGRVLVASLCLACALLVSAACDRFPSLRSPFQSVLPLPPLDQQKLRIRQGAFQPWTLTARAFVEEWGPPTYDHRESMQFFVMDDGVYVPRFRVPLGESPSGWSSMVASGAARFLGYVDRGELLGFLDERMVYRERMPAEQIHAVGKQWQRDERFKTSLETPGATPR